MKQKTEQNTLPISQRKIDCFVALAEALFSTRESLVVLAKEMRRKDG